MSAAVGLVILLVIGVWWYRRYGETFKWYLTFYRVNITARRFYAKYEGLSRDVTFHPSRSPKLDVYSPQSGTDHPVFIYIHGGSWQMYDKLTFAPVAKTLLPEEMVVVIPDYTLHPDADFEQMTNEVAAAVSWTLENITYYNGDPKRIIVAGHSAGAHLATLALMDTRFLNAFGHDQSEVYGLVGMSGVYDIQAQDAYHQTIGVDSAAMTTIMQGRDNFAKASPINYHPADLPPTLLIHGDQDTTVPVDITVNFHSQLMAAGHQSELKLYEGVDHTSYLFDAVMKKRSRTITDLSQFVHQYLPMRNHQRV